MGFLDQFIIPFSGLSLGNHHFDYQIDGKFFDSFEYSEIPDGSLEIVVNMERQERMMIFNISINGTVTVPCDRCLDPYELEVSGQEVLYVKFGDHYEEESAEVIIIPRTEHRFNLASILYEMILLNLPYQRIHPDNEDGDSNCNPEILKKLEELQPEKPIDPRWEGLKGLDLNN